MEIKRVLNFSQEEFDLLVKTGQFLAEVNNNKENFDDLSEDSLKLVVALKDQLNKLVA